MIRYSNHIIDTWIPKTLNDCNGTAKLGTDGVSIWLEVYSDDEKFETVIDIRDILYAMSEVI